MKKHCLITVCSFFALLLSLSTTAQTNKKACNWLSEKGFWVVESNRQTPENSTVYFYNNDRLLVYKEEIRNQKLNLNKKKTLYRLKAALEQAIELSSSGTWASQTGLVTNSLQD
jgi:hypothetical protein